MTEKKNNTKNSKKKNPYGEKYYGHPLLFQKTFIFLPNVDT